MDDLIKELKNKNEEFSEDYINKMKEYYQKAMSNPNDLVNQLNGLNLNQPDAEGGLIIVPEKFCCVKTTDSSGQKVFINILHHEKIEPPKEEHLLELDNQLGVRIPLSLSEKYEDFDTKNQMCQVYDVIYNSNVVKKSDKDPNLFHFMIGLAMTRILERFKHQLNSNFLRLKNLVYKGKAVRPQRIRVRKGPKIEEVIKRNDEGQASPNYSAQEISKQVNEKGKTPNWSMVILKQRGLSPTVFKEISGDSKRILEGKVDVQRLIDHNMNVGRNFSYFDGTNANPKGGNALLFIIELELLSRGNGINLNICEEAILVNCGKVYSLELSMPYKICPSDSYSFFETEKRILYIMSPFYEEDIREIEQLGKEKAENISNVRISDDYLYDLIV